MANWLNSPACVFLTLNITNDPVAKRNVENIRTTLEKELTRFNGLSGLPPIDLQAFLHKFVNKLLNDKENRTILSAFYVFLLEYQERYNELKLRSTEQGSIQPVIVHLFIGGLIFESLLKVLYPQNDNGNRTKTLRNIFEDNSDFQNDFGINVVTSSSSLGDIFTDITDNTLETAFSTTSKIRNTTGHKLVWDDIFDIPDNYKSFFQQEVNAILYIIAKKYI